MRARKQTISANTSLIELIGELRDAEDYVRVIFGKMHRLRDSSPDDVCLELGLFSSRKFPDYRIQMFIGDDTSRSYFPCEAFDGKRHRPLAEDRLLDDHLWGWGQEYVVIKQLLGFLRGRNECPISPFE